MSRPKGSKNKEKFPKRRKRDDFVAKSSLPLYKVVFTTVGKKFTAEGEFLREAISNLKPDIAKAHGILSIEKEGKRYEKILTRVTVQRLFGSGNAMSKELALKNICLLFGDI